MTTSPNRLPPEEYLEIADKVRTGEYFRETRSMYDLRVHDQMSDRYFYMLLTAIAIVVFLITFLAMRSLYPLQADVPFAVSSNNLAEDVPRIKSLLHHKGENPSIAFLRFLGRNYVKAYEEYSINTFDRNINGVKSQSAESVVAEYQKLIDPNNPDSPLTLYQRHSTRDVTIISSSENEYTSNEIEIVFEATVRSKTEVKKTRWQADITFNYSGLELDEKTGKAKPFEFMVTKYRSKRLQDIR